MSKEGAWMMVMVARFWKKVKGILYASSSPPCSFLCRDLEKNGPRHFPITLDPLMEI
jgi:hypothetical protein